MKKICKCFSVLFIAALLLATSVLGSSALTLYTDGDYTFADIDEENVALYAYSGSSPVLTIPESYNGKNVSSVYNYAFEDNTSITAIDFSQASRFFNSIGMKSFVNCTGLSGELSLPVSITNIDHAAFQGCSKITMLALDSSVRTVPAQCFNRCSSLKTVTISPFTESIDNLALANCPSLKDVYLQTAVTNISETAFMNSPNVVLHVYYGSYAYDYSITNRMNYILLDDVKLGDADEDDDVNINDATRIQSYLAELDALDGIYLHASDANEDGEIDISDATAIQMYAAEFQTGHPIGQVMLK